MNGTSSNKKKSKRGGGAVSTIIIIAAIAVMIFALYKLVPILLDYKQADDTYKNLQNEVVTEADDNDTGSEDTTEDLPDWAKVTIDFESLKEINPDVIGWIRFDDPEALPIDYPILYSGDNDTYLRHDLYGENHTAGSIFMEALNTPDFSDYHTIIYGHNMKNGSMFGSLKQYKRDETLYDSNPFFTLYTEQTTYRYQIFAYSDVSEDSEIYTIGYSPDEAYQNLINLMISNSIRNTGIVPTPEDHIITLSTCSSSGDNIRFVVHAVCVDQRTAGLQSAAE